MKMDVFHCDPCGMGPLNEISHLMGDLFLSAQRVCMTLGHVRHNKCLNLTKIASHMSNVPVVSRFVWSRSNSCPVCSYDSNVFPSFPTVLTVFHLFSHSEGLEKNKKCNTGHPRLKTRAGWWPLENAWCVSSWCQQPRHRKCNSKSKFGSELFIVAASINILQAHWKKLMTLNITLMIYIPEGDVLEKAEIIPCIVSACHHRHADDL